MLPNRLSILPILLLVASPLLEDPSGCPDTDDDDMATATPTTTPKPEPGDGATYYVAPWGDDTNPGTLDAPWQSLEKAATTARAGDTVYLREGTWYERLIPHNSGTEAHPIVFAAMPGERAVLDGTGVFSSQDPRTGVVHLSDVSYIRIIGLEVVHSPQAGILADTTTGVWIEDNRTYDTFSSGIGVWYSTDVMIVDNEVELACNDGDQECITVAATDGFEVVGNHVFNGGPGTQGGEGIDTKQGSRNGSVRENLVHDLSRVGIYVDAWNEHTYNIEVAANAVHHCESTGFAVAAESGGLLENVRLTNNLAWLNTYNGMTVASWGRPTAHPMLDIEIVNNTFVQNGVSWGGGIELQNGEADGVLVRNNILSQNNNYQILLTRAGENLVMDHNLVDGFRGDDPREVTGDAAILASPAFVDPEAFDLHLTSGSPAVDAGALEAAPDQDFDGVSRPQGDAVDIGAYEFVP